MTRVMNTGIMMLKEPAMPAGTDGGILILMASMVVSRQNSEVKTRAVAMPTNRPWAPKVVLSIPAMGASRPSTVMVVAHMEI